jgi:diaminopimelate epimerase
MLIDFYKYQSIGNDFVLIDLDENKNLNQKEFSNLSIAICDRNFGVGSDGLIILSAAKMLFINPDGTFDVCGNGMRCVADYIYAKRKQNSFSIQTDFSDVEVNILKDNYIETIHPKVINFARVTSADFDGVLANSGTPHFCLFDCDFDAICVEQLGAKLEKIVDPNQLVNIDFISKQIYFSKTNPLHVDIRIWERGVGQTLGCGTAAIAVSSVINSMHPNIIQFRIKSIGGELSTLISDRSISLIGRAQLVYSGKFNFLSKSS